MTTGEDVFARAEAILDEGRPRRRSSGGKAAVAPSAVAPGSPGPLPVRSPVLTRLSDVATRETTWLWRGYIPLGNLTIIEGHPGLGKSTFTLDLAARVTRGASMPDGSTGIDGEVLICTAEDSVAETVKPRVEAAGGDATRVITLEAPLDAELTIPLTLPDDLQLLRIALEMRPAVRLVVIDPITAFWSTSIDTYKDPDVRRVMARLKALAEEFTIAIVLVRHLVKMQGGRAITRGGGSIGIGAAARSVLVIDVDPGAAEGRVLASTKSNLGPRPVSQLFHLEPSGASSKIVYDGASELTADDLSSGARASASDSSDEFLRSLLTNGPLAVKEVREMSRKGGYGRAAIDKARKAIGARAERAEFGGAVAWSLDHGGKGVDGDHTRHAGGVGGHGENGENGENGQSDDDVSEEWF